MASGMNDSSCLAQSITEDEGVLEVDRRVLDGVGGVQKDLTLAIERYGASWLVHTIGILDQGSVVELLRLHSSVLVD